ncbi:MAG: hypothetical protein C0407_07240 [Desulfobacca sp.]|nr:hypothetical protein [Desulfobacca sp.]
MSPKIDFKKEWKHLYSPSAREVVLVEVSAMNFVMGEGRGDPNTSPDFKGVVEALYSLSYTLKFMVKKDQGIDYTVLPLEGLWWADDMAAFSPEDLDKSRWQWTVMIAQPDFIGQGLFVQAMEPVKKKKPLPFLSLLRWESLHEGLCAQILHVGPYAQEHPTIEKIHNFMKEEGYDFAGKHHEIYLSDPRKTAPEKLKTIIRQPIRKIPVQGSR